MDLPRMTNMVRIKCWVCHSNGAILVAADVFTSAVPIVFGSALTMATFVLVVPVVVACFNSWDHFYLFLYVLFQKFQNFSQIYSLLLWFTFGF